MKTPYFALIRLLLLWLCFTSTARTQVVSVTARLDSTNILVGATTTLHILAQVIPAQQTNADRIFSWYVDVLNTNGPVASANYNAMLKSASDNDPSTSSTGTADGANRRGVYDTFLNLPGAGVSAPVELMAIPVTGLVAGQTRFRLQAGTGAGLSSDFLVAPKNGGDPMIGGVYTAAEVVLVVSSGPPSFAVSISVTNAPANTKGVTLRFPTVAGFNYTAQYRDQLPGGTGWQALPGAPHNSGAAYDLSAAGTRFYRVSVAPASELPSFVVSISVTNAPANAKGVTLRFPTVAGFNYTAQYRDQLPGGTSWQALPGAPHNSGVAYDLSAAGSRFYRVSVAPASGLPSFAVSMSVTNAGANSKGVTLRFPTTAGFNYTAQYRDQLAGAIGWQALPGAPHNSGTAYDLSTAGSRFYRVAVTPAN